MSQATWADPTATWASLDCAWDGTFLGSVTPTRTVGSGLLGRRGPYDERDAPVSRNPDDDDILVLTATF